MTNDRYARLRVPWKWWRFPSKRKMQWIPRCPTWGSNAIHIFSAKRIPSSPSWLRRCSVCSTGDSVLRPLILKLGLSENAGVPKPMGLKLETSFPPWNLGHTHFQIDPLHILLIRYIPFIYIYIYIYVNAYEYVDVDVYTYIFISVDVHVYVYVYLYPMKVDYQ